MFEPKAVDTRVVTGESSIPLAIFEIVLAVAGQTKIRSALPNTLGRSPAKKTCSTTMRYSDMTLERKRKAAEELDYGTDVS